MAVFLSVLKIIGIVLLALIGILLLILLLILLCPFRYRIEAAKTEEITAGARVTWLLHLIAAEVLWGGDLNIRLKVFGLPIYDKKRKEAKAAAKAAKEAEKRRKKDIKQKAAGYDAGTDEEAEEEIKEITQENRPEAERPENDAPDILSDDTPQAAEESGEIQDREPEAQQTGADAGNDTGKDKSGKKNTNRNRKISISGIADAIGEKWDRFLAFLDRAPDKLADWLEYLPDKADELLETIGYYERLLGSEGTEWVLGYVKEHGGKLLFHCLPRRTDGTLDYCDDDPGKVAKIYQYQALSLPILDRICGRRGHFDVLALQDEKKIHLQVKTRGRIVVAYIAWHGGCLLLNRKVKAFLKRLRREE